MRVLIVKTSSMGDVIHTLPALTDASKAIPGITFDWVVEENFAEIPAWHPQVNKVIPMAFRRWRKNLFSKATRQEWFAFLTNLREHSYDLVIDAQGLVKSGFISRFAKGKRLGLDWKSARESLASLFYQKKCTVEFNQHAVIRARSLFSLALGYQLPTTTPDYGIDRQAFVTNSDDSYVLFLHGTTWATKHWPETYWAELGKLVNRSGYKIKLPWGNAAEKERAERIAGQCEQAEVLPRLNLASMASVLAGAKKIVAVDTGLGHLAAALDVPTISLYGPTNATLTGAVGKSQTHLSAQFPCSPCLSKVCTYVQEPASLYPSCFITLQPLTVWKKLSLNE